MKIRHKAMARAAHRTEMRGLFNRMTRSYYHPTYGWLWELPDGSTVIDRWHRNYRGMR